MRPNFALYAVHRDLVDATYPYVQKYLSASTQLSDGAFTPEDILHSLKSGEMQLWVVSTNSIIYCALITEVKQFPHQKHLNILFLGGDEMPEWIHLIDDIVNRAKINDCDAVKIYGRKGWEKVLAKYGFKHSHCVLKRDLGESS